MQNETLLCRNGGSPDRHCMLEQCTVWCSRSVVRLLYHREWGASSVEDFYVSETTDLRR